MDMADMQTNIQQYSFVDQIQLVDIERSAIA